MKAKEPINKKKKVYMAFGMDLTIPTEQHITWRSQRADVLAIVSVVIQKNMRKFTYDNETYSLIINSILTEISRVYPMRELTES